MKLVYKIFFLILILSLSSLHFVVASKSQDSTITSTVTKTVTKQITQTTTLTWTEYNRVTTTITVKSSTVKTSTSVYYLFQSFPGESLVLFLGSGSIVGEAIHVGGINEEIDFILMLKRLGLDVVVPRYSVAREPTFPLEVISYIKETRGYDNIFLIGWSAGGVAAAWSLILDDMGIIDKGVIANTILKTEEDNELLNSYKYARQVQVPHLIIWGRTDEFAGLENASAWIEGADPDLGSLYVFDYGHYWWDTGVESDVTSTIISFLTDDYIDVQKMGSQIGESRFGVRASSPISGSSYDSNEKLFMINLEQHMSSRRQCTIAIPTGSIDGEPVVLINGVETRANWIVDRGKTYTASTLKTHEDYYIINFDYDEGKSNIVLGGSYTIPEYPRELSFLLLAGSLAILLIITRSRKISRTGRIIQNIS